MKEQMAKTKMCPFRVIIFNLEKLAGTSDASHMNCVPGECVFWISDSHNPENCDCALAPKKID